MEPNRVKIKPTKTVKDKTYKIGFYIKSYNVFPPGTEVIVVETTKRGCWVKDTNTSRKGYMADALGEYLYKIKDQDISFTESTTKCSNEQTKEFCSECNTVGKYING